MALFQPTSVAAVRLGMAQAALLLGITVIPIPADWTRTQRVMASASAGQPNRADGDHHATGYYEGLIGGEGQGGRGELTLRLMGKPNGCMRFNDAGVARHLNSDFLQFELVPNMDSVLFGQPFVTNSHGMHGPEVAVEKPEKTFRIAVLGASMDMGWGVKFQDTYSYQLQEWLNAHAAHQAFASDRKFEVLNFAVAAYSPLQRLESFRRKAREFRPDLVIFSSTLLDIRLMEIHLCDMFRTKSDPTYGFLRDLIARAGITEQDREVDAKGSLVYKDRIKSKLEPHYWELYDASVGELAGECRSAGIPMLMIVIPRVGKDDKPAVRAEPVARLKAIAGRYGLPIFDLSDTFDEMDPATLEIAAWDDHPNALGHHRLFLSLTHHLVTDQGKYELLFPGRKAAAEASLPPDLP
jgi:hypothetical protein